MQVKIVKAISTEIISNLQLDTYSNLIAIITRKLATQTSKYQYYLETYNQSDLSLIAKKYLYSSYSQRKHFLAFGINSIAVEIRSRVYVLDKKTLEITRKITHPLMQVKDIAFSKNERFLGLVGDGVLVWQGPDRQLVTVNQIPSQSFWSYIQFHKVTDFLIISSLVEIKEYMFLGPRNQFVSISNYNINPDINSASIITSLSTSPLRHDQILIGLQDDNIHYFSLQNQLLFRKSEDSQPFKDKYKVASYLPNGQGYVSGDLNGFSVQDANQNIHYEENPTIIGAIQMNKEGYLYNHQWKSLRKVELLVECPDGEFRKTCSCPPSSYWSITHFQCKPCDDLCQCSSGFIFNEMYGKCIRKCQQIANGFRDNAQADACGCRQPYIWNRRQKKCEFQCQNFAYVEATNPGQNGNCNCPAGLIWKQNRCQCPTIYEKYNPDSQVCDCILRYSKNSEGICTIDCSPFISLSYLGNKNPQQCNCINEQSTFVVDQNGYSGCQRRCDTVNNVIPDITYLDDSCQCDQHYFWDREEQKCRVDCTEASQEKTRQVGNQQTCKCPNGYFWRKQIAQCARNCSTQPYTLEISTNKRCKCKPNFQWNQINRGCQINCTGIKDATQYKKDVAECQCRNGFSWHEEKYVCLVNCSDIDDAYRHISDQECECKGGKVYDQQKAMCVQQNCSLILCDVWVTVGVVIGALIALGLILALIRCCIIYYRDRKRQKQIQQLKQNKVQQDYIIHFRKDSGFQNLESGQRVHIQKAQ